jgi:hypothetical protein
MIAISVVRHPTGDHFMGKISLTVVNGSVNASRCVGRQRVIRVNIAALVSLIKAGTGGCGTTGEILPTSLVPRLARPADVGRGGTAVGCRQAQRLIRQSPWPAVRHRVSRWRRDGPRPSGEPAKMMKGDNLTEQFSQRTRPDDGRQVGDQGLFRDAGQEGGERDPAARSIAPSAAA